MEATAAPGLFSRDMMMHRTAAVPRKRKRSGSRDPRYSSARWIRESRAYLAAHPLCECGHDCLQPSAFLDHHVAVKDGGDFWDQSNWRALSDRCHRLKSRVEQGRRGELAPVTCKPLRIKGADVHGYPLDPQHHWNRG